MYPFYDRKEKLFGYRNHGEWEIMPRFRRAFRFQSGWGYVELPDGCDGFVDAHGNFQSIRDIVGMDRWYAFDMHGFSQWDDTTSQYAVVCCDNGGEPYWGVLDRTLTFRELPRTYFAHVTRAYIWDTFIIVFHDLDECLHHSGIFDTLENREVLAPGRFAISPGRGGCWAIAATGRDNGIVPESWRYFETQRRTFLSGCFFAAAPFACGLAAACRANETFYRVFDAGFVEVFNRTFDWVDMFSLERASAIEGGQVGLIDIHGHFLPLMHYETVGRFNRLGWSIANRNEDKWSIDIIDRHGAAHMRNLDTAEFWDGDFPYFEVTQPSGSYLLDARLHKVEAN